MYKERHYKQVFLYNFGNFYFRLFHRAKVLWEIYCNLHKFPHKQVRQVFICSACRPCNTRGACTDVGICKFFTPSAICKAVSGDTAPSVLRVSSLTPSTLCLISFAYEQTPQSKTSLAPLTAVILPESKPPVQLSAVASLRLFL